MSSRFRVFIYGVSFFILFVSAASGQAPVTTKESTAQEASTNEPLKSKIVDVLQADKPKIIAIGDVHGDYKQFIKVLRSAKLIDKKRRWIAGDTTFVQVGDLTDRGPDSRKLIDLLINLREQAAKQGGSVQVVIGNHEVMNVTGDLRFVHKGEYKAFKDKNSKIRQRAYYQQTVKALREDHAKGESSNEEFELPKDHQKQWKKNFPLGFVEHRMAWEPMGDYGKWTLSNSAVLKVNHVLFVHGGLSEQYSNMSISELNTRARTEIADSSRWGEGSLIDDPNGPFWYRGWATLEETPENHATLDRVLKAYDVDRMVVAHTPLINTILPRFDGKVVVVDIGMSAYYGGANAALELAGDRGETAYAIVEGHRLELPNDSAGVLDYLTAAQALVKDKTKIERYKANLAANKATKVLEVNTPVKKAAQQ